MPTYLLSSQVACPLWPADPSIPDPEFSPQYHPEKEKKYQHHPCQDHKWRERWLKINWTSMTTEHLRPAAVRRVIVPKVAGWYRNPHVGGFCPHHVGNHPGELSRTWFLVWIGTKRSSLSFVVLSPSTLLQTFLRKWCENLAVQHVAWGGVRPFSLGFFSAGLNENILIILIMEYLSMVVSGSLKRW